MRIGNILLILIKERVSRDSRVARERVGRERRRGERERDMEGERWSERGINGGREGSYKEEETFLLSY